jgi:putative ABC transport system permease protein
MDPLRLAWRNVLGSSFRSGVVFLCALFVAGLTLSTTLIMRGTQDSLRLAADRLGADIIVVPEGAETKVESALLLGTPNTIWMPADDVGKLAAIPGVAAVSPQLFLWTLSAAPCCSASQMFVVAFDPATDFTVQPWLKSHVPGGLGLGDAVGGSDVFVPFGEKYIKIYGYYLTLKANLEPTGTDLDQTLFLTFDTARDVARLSVTRAMQPLVIPPDSVSAVLLRLEPGAVTDVVALEIVQTLPDIAPIQSANLFRSYRQQMLGLLEAVVATLVLTWVLAILLIGLVFSMAVNERRREIAVLRAMGATRAFVLRSLLAEAGILALSGGAAGALIAVLATWLFRDALISSLGVPYLFPGPLELLELVAAGLAVALAGVALAAFVPAYRINHQDPASAMRE